MTTAVLIDSSSNQGLQVHSSRRRVVQKDANTIYVFYQDEAPTSHGHSYKKSIDGGLTWADNVPLGTDSVSDTQVDIFCDNWQNPSVVHIFNWRDTSGGTRGGWHRKLTLSSDTLSALVHATGALGASGGGGSGGVCVATSGRIHVCANGSIGGTKMVYSDNGGSSWVAAGASFSEHIAEDLCQMWDDPESADPNDIRAIYFDQSANQLSLKQYDASAGTISETVIATLTWGSATAHIASLVMPNGHLYVAATNGSGEILTWDITGTTVTARTSVVASGGTAPGLMALSNGFVYCYYVASGAVYRKFSTDGMVTWSAATLYSSRANTPTEIMLPAYSLSNTYTPVVYRETASLYIEEPVPQLEVDEEVDQYRLMLAEEGLPDVPVLDITSQNFADKGETLVRFERGSDPAVLGNPPRAGEASVRLTNQSAGYELDQPKEGLALRLNKRYDDGVDDTWHHHFQGNITVPGTHFGAGSDGFRIVKTLRAIGSLAKLQGKTVSTELLGRGYDSPVSTGTCIEALLDAAGFPLALRDIDAGQVMLPYWWASNEDAMSALQKLLNAEGPTCELYEDGEGRLIFRQRSARYTESRSTTVQTTITSQGAAPHISGPVGQPIYTPGSIGSVINSAKAQRISRTNDTALSTVWEDDNGSGEYTLRPNESLTLEAVGDEPYFDAVTPVDGVDYEYALGSVAVSLDRDSGQNVQITFTAGPSGVALGGVGGDGIKLRAYTTIARGPFNEVARVDASASITNYGVRPWQGEMWADMFWWDMHDNLDAIVTLAKEPVGRVIVTINALSSDEANEAVAMREIGDRIRVIETALDADFDCWIQRISGEIKAPAASPDGDPPGWEAYTYDCLVIAPNSGSQGSGIGEENPYDSINNSTLISEGAGQIVALLGYDAVLQNEVKGWPPLVQVGAGLDLVTAGQWWDTVATPTTEFSAVPVSGEAGLDAKFFHVGKCVTNAVNEGFHQRFTYADEPRIKSGKVISALIWVGSTAGSVDCTVKLLNSDATETVGTLVATDGDWDLYAVLNHTTAGTYVDLQVTKDTAGTFYAGGNITVMLGANVIGLPPRKLVYRKYDATSSATAKVSNDGEGDTDTWTDVDCTAQTSALAARVQMELLIAEFTAGFRYYTRRNGDAGAPQYHLIQDTTVETRPTVQVEEILDDAQIFEYKIDRWTGSTTVGTAKIYLLGYWEWE